MENTCAPRAKSHDQGHTSMSTPTAQRAHNTQPHAQHTHKPYSALWIITQTRCAHPTPAISRVFTRLACDATSTGARAESETTNGQRTYIPELLRPHAMRSFFFVAQLPASALCTRKQEPSLRCLACGVALALRASWLPSGMRQRIAYSIAQHADRMLSGGRSKRLADDARCPAASLLVVQLYAVGWVGRLRQPCTTVSLLFRI